MSAFFATLQAYFATAVAYIAQTSAFIMVMSAVTYLASVMVVTFGLGLAVATGIAYALFAILVLVVAWGAWKLGKWLAPKVASGYQWAKAKVTGLFRKEKTAAEQAKDLGEDIGKAASAAMNKAAEAAAATATEPAAA